MSMSNNGFPADQFRIDHEAHLSTVKNASCTHPWLSCAHENARRPRRHPCAPSQRAGPPQRLIKSAVCNKSSGARSIRLTKAAQFEAVLVGGRRSGSKCFLARALPNAGDGPRLGLIVGKKAAPRSVDRNRVKRLIRIVHRELAAELDALDVVVQLRGSPRSSDNAALFKELQELLRGLLGPGKK